MRLILFLTSLAAALALAVMTTRTPAPVPASAPAGAFSAERAMVDVARMARAPHPVGSAEHAVVQAYLMRRLADLGLEPQRQIGALSPTAVRRIETQGASADGLMAVNLVGVLPGRRADLTAVALMAHYDSVPGSPGAADDAAGVAAILEAVRAVKARGPADRTLVVLLTDAEELNLDGARAFFSEHPLRDRIGAVINLEARGGGGRAMMFETGRGNAPTIDRFAQAAPRVTGGASANALAVFVYRLMPNGTDFTIAADRGLAGINLAFIGRPAQYHAAAATPQALDMGSVQHIGSQALEMADALLRGPDLPKAGQDAVHADLFGLIVLHHAPGFGWVLLAAAVALTAFAAWGARHFAGLRAASVGRGVLDGLWLVSAGVVVAQAVRGLSGPMGARVDSAAIYYALLRRLPWIEVAAALAVLAVVLALLAGTRAVGRNVMAVILALATVASTVMGGASALIIGAGLLSVVLSLGPQPDQASDGLPWGEWLGLVVLVMAVGAGAQAVAPEAAFIFIWTGLAASLAAAVAAVMAGRIRNPRRGWIALVPPLLATVLVGAWLLGLGHFVFLGVGMDLPGALGLIALLILMQARPLAPTPGGRRVAMLAAACLVLACGAALAGRWITPAAPSAGYMSS